MVASGEIISLILRDESLHGKYIGLLAQEIYMTFDKEEKESLKDKMYSILNNLMENEIEYTNKIYDGTNLENDVIDFLQYNANRALENLGFEKHYDVKEINPIVLNGLSTETKTHDFFSTKGNGYQKGIYEELEDEDFIID
jgi:ribonucleoside-diphosphate reductase beta chain